MTQKLFFFMQPHFLVHLARLRTFGKKKYKDVGSSMERFLRSGCKLTTSDKFFKQCDRVRKTKKNLYLL